MGDVMREIALDTETTGISTKHDRIVEIACIELVGRVPTGRRLHKYFNPQKPISEGALRAHVILPRSSALLRSLRTMRRMTLKY